MGKIRIEVDHRLKLYEDFILNIHIKDYKKINYYNLNPEENALSVLYHFRRICTEEKIPLCFRLNRANNRVFIQIDPTFIVECHKPKPRVKLSDALESFQSGVPTSCWFSGPEMTFFSSLSIQQFHFWKDKFNLKTKGSTKGKRYMRVH